MATYTEPSPLELELGRETAHVDTGSIDAHARAIADALAAHRYRCTALVEHTLEALAARGLSEHALSLFAGGWTPGQVHSLIENAREVRRGLRLAPQVIREALTSRLGEPSTYAELTAARKRIVAAHQIARAMQGSGGVRTAVLVDKLIATLAG
jgi:hypothetical protein